MPAIHLAAVVLWLLAMGQAMPPGSARDGWEAIQRGDAEKAASAFRQALTLNPQDAQSLAGAGMAAHLLGRDDQAMSSLKRALAIRPDYAYAAYVLAQVAYAQADLDLAIKSLEKVIALSPGSPGVYQQLQDWKREASLHASFNAQPGVRFNILFEGPEQRPIADRVATILERAYANVGKALNTYPPETISAILYTKEQFRAITHAPGWAAGAYDGRIRIPVLGALRVPGELERVVTHEFVHAAINSVAPRGVPVWLNEGLATYFEPTDHAWLERRLRTAPQLLPVRTLESSFGELDGEEALLAYAQSWAAAGLLVQRLGPNFPVFLQYVGNGTSVEQALLLFNITDADLRRAWTSRSHR
jgi:tetratricopeptide (TPR) repeat protein